MKSLAALASKAQGRQPSCALLTLLTLASAWSMVIGCSSAPPEPSPSTATAQPPRSPTKSDSTGGPVANEPVAPAQPNPVSAVEEPQKPTVQTIQFDPEHLKFAMVAIGTSSEGWFGYGVVIGRSATGFDVMTADHVLEGRKSLMVQAWQGDKQKSQLQSYLSVTTMHRSPVEDLAWLRVRAADTDVLPLTIAQPEELDAKPVWTYRVDQQRPVFERYVIEKSVTAQRNSRAKPVVYLRLEKRIEPGLSGGGLVNAHGQWLGIASGNNTNQAHYVAPSEIVRFLKEAGLR